jgi:peptide-methionine (S)-S-oxide reductase
MKSILITLLLATILLPAISISATETAIFSTGCFWCSQSDFDKVPGVTNTTVGYVGDTQSIPTYKTVSSGKTNFAEGIEIEFDNTVVSYSQLLDYFWTTTDPTVKDQQFCDIGHQYRSGIFYLNDQQKTLALASRNEIERILPVVHTQVEPATRFYPAEEYHQDYYKKNPVRYKFYRWNCGRDKRLEEVWGEN